MSRAHRILVDLKRIRKEVRISQDAIGAALGVAQNRMSQYELGQVRPRVDLICDWAETLGYELVLVRKET